MTETPDFSIAKFFDQIISNKNQKIFLLTFSFKYKEFYWKIIEEIQKISQKTPDLASSQVIRAYPIDWTLEKKHCNIKTKFTIPIEFMKNLLAVKRFKLIYLEMTESTNSMRSVNSVGKVDFAWSGIVENLNGEILFASFVEFFEQSVVQSFRLMDTFSCKKYKL